LASQKIRLFFFVVRNRTLVSRPLSPLVLEHEPRSGSLVSVQILVPLNPYTVMPFQKIDEAQSVKPFLNDRHYQPDAQRSHR
jgi:hypothetical protein